MIAVQFFRICRSGFFLFGLVLTAGCGGPGDSNLGGPSFNALLDERETLAEKSLGLTESLSLPDQDGVVYNGVFYAVDESSFKAYVGDFSATVDFKETMMHGDIDAIYLVAIDSQGDPVGNPVSVAGSIDVDSASVDKGPFDLTFSGDLYVNGALRTIEVVDPNGVGVFLGANGDMFDALGTLKFEGINTSLEASVVAD